jgi:hypothetical protein
MGTLIKGMSVNLLRGLNSPCDKGKTPVQRGAITLKTTPHQIFHVCPETTRPQLFGFETKNAQSTLERVVGYSWILRECFPSGGSSEDRFVDTTRRLLHIRGGWPWTSGFCILRAWGMMERGGSVWPITSGLKGLSDFPPNIQTYNCSWKVHRNRTAEAFLDPQIAQIRHKLVLHAIPLHKNRKKLNSSRRQRHLSIWPQQWRRSGRNLKT